MRTTKYTEIVARPPRHKDIKIRVRRERRRQVGLIALLLIFLLVLTASPVSASESPSRLLDTAPFAFTKTNPMDDQINQSVNLTLTWDISKFTDEYFYCIDTTINSACDDTWRSTGLNTFKDLASLSYSTTFEWQVYAFNELGTTYANTATWWQFTTAEAPPGAFGKSSPVDDVTDLDTSLTLGWNASSTADSYEYCYDSTLDNACAGSWTSAGTSTSAAISGLDNGTQYEWQVRASNSNPLMTYADGGEWWHFTTMIPPPITFSKTSPSSGAISQLINLTLSWGASAYSSSYEYCIDSNLAIDHAGVCDGIWTNTILTYANIEDLAYETQYEWQVRAINTSGTTYANTGTWWSFTTKANPTGLYKISPGDLTSNHPVSLALEWSSYGGTTSYEYCVDPTSSGTSGSCDSGWVNISMNTIVTVDLAYGAEYEWQVRANDSEVTYADGGDWWTFTTVVGPPSWPNPLEPDKLIPLDGAITQPLTLTLSWVAASGATSYRYCIDDNLDTTCNASWISVATNSAEITGLTYNTIYEWQVRAYNNNPSYTSADSGAWFQFTTVVAQPGNFLKLSPTDGDVNLPLNPTLSWSTSGGATSYEICYDANIDQTCGTSGNGSWTSTGALTSANLNSLVNSTSYEWQVRARNANPNPTYANSNTWWTFTTITAPPGAFTKVGPVHGASDLLPSTVTLQWTASAGAESYWYCIDTTVNSTCDGSWVYAGAGTSVLLTDLIFNTTYQWQMRAVNANPSITYADGNVWWTFSTRVGTNPSPYTKIYPADTSIDIPTNPTLRWAPATYASHYEYCIDSNLNIGHVNVCDSTWISTLSSTQVSLSGLALNTPYEWHVRAYNDTVGPTYSNSGNWWTFTTVQVHPPEPFGKVSPANGVTLQPLSLTLDWDPATNATLYEYCFDSTMSGSCNSSWQSTVTTSATISGLAYGTLYEWQVRSYNGLNPNPTSANGGSWWSYTTVPAPPGSFVKNLPGNNATDQPVNLNLTWSTSSEAVSYEYCYEVSDGDSTCDGSWVPTGTPIAAISGLNYATTYDWQVRALNANPQITYADAGTWFTFTTTIAPPGSFAKLTPVNAAVNQPLSLSLSWSASSGATSYAFCYDSTINSACNSGWISTTGTNTTLASLTNSTLYEWQVRALNINPSMTYADGNTWHTFTTVETPPVAFNKAGPADTSTNRPLNPSLTWAASSGVEGYEYCIDTSLNSSCAGNTWVSTGTQVSVNLSGLNNNTTYQWQVRAYNDNPARTYANDSTWWTFTTVVAAPGDFVKTSPADSAINQPSSQYLTWGASSFATGYEYCVDSNLAADCQDTWHTTSLLYANVPGLAFGLEYQWQVRALNINGQTEANSDTWWTFEVEPAPGTFSKRDPNEGAINQPTALTITWTNVDGATGYEFCYDTTINDTCDSDIWTSSVPNPLFALLSLENSTEYEWQARAIVGGLPVYANQPVVPTPTGTWWSFTTVQPPAGSFSKSTPGIGASGQPANNLTLSWAPSSGATGYRYCLDTSLNGTCNTNWVDIGNVTSVVLSNLNYSTPYSWQVWAYNEHPDQVFADNGVWSSFTTILAPPLAFRKLNPTDHSLDQLIDLSLSWETAVGATSGYQYCIDTSIDSTCNGTGSWIATSNTSVALTALLNDTRYEWQVQAFSANPFDLTEADDGAWFVFDTVVAPPGEFNKISPASGTADLPADLMLAWEPSPGAAGYEYCVDLDLVNPGCDGTWIATSLTQALITDLVHNTPYEWHVRAVNANPVITDADSGDWWNFDTIPLFYYTPVIIKPGLPSPVLNPVTVGAVGSNSYTLSWNAVAGATKYKIWESTSPTSFPTNPKYETTATSRVLPIAVNPTRYYYYVRAASTTRDGPKSNTIAVDRQYELEDNGSAATANGQIFPGVTYRGQITDQKDYFKIYMDAPGTITVTMNTFPTSWVGQLQLFEDNTGNLRAADVSPSGGWQVTYTGDTANWYYIYFATVSSLPDSWYSFTVTITPTP